MFIKNNFKVFCCYFIILFLFALSCSVGKSKSSSNNNLKVSAPTNITANAEEKRVTISWDNVVKASSYNIYWSNTTGVNKTNGTKIANAVSPYAHMNLDDDTKYYYIVTGVNANGESSVSKEAFAITPKVIPLLLAPTSIIATVESKKITISWDSASNASSYNIYWSNTIGVNKTNGTKIANAVSPYVHADLVDNLI